MTDTLSNVKASTAARNRLLVIAGSASTLLAAVVVAFQVFRDPSQQTIILEAAAAAALIIPLIGLGWAIAWALSDARRERSANQMRLRCPVARVSAVDPSRIGVSEPAEPKLAKHYLRRTPADLELRKAIVGALGTGDQWMVMVVGAAKVGKSRTLLEALRRHDQTSEPLEFVAPVDLQALRDLLNSGSAPVKLKGAAVLWLDDIGPFLMSGLTVDDLLRWRAGSPKRMVAATYGNTASSNSMQYFVKHVLRVGLNVTTRVELQTIRAKLSREDFESACSHGWAAYLVAGPMLELKLTTARHSQDALDSYEGLAIALAAIDWARCGRITAPSEHELKALWLEYLPPTLPPTEERFKSGLDWATRPVAATVALVEYRQGYAANSYVVRLRTQDDISGPRDAAWAAALRTDSFEEVLNVGLRAADVERWAYAIDGCGRAAEAPDDALPPVLRSVALLALATAHTALRQPAPALYAFDQALTLNQDGLDPTSRGLTASALMGKSRIYSDLEKPQEELRICQEVIDRNIHDIVATVSAPLFAALYNKGNSLMEIGESGERDQAITAWQQVIDEYFRLELRGLDERRTTAQAMYNLSNALQATPGEDGNRKRNRSRAMKVLDELVREFGSDMDPLIRLTVGDGLINRGHLIVGIGLRSEENIAKAQETLKVCERRLLADSLARGDASRQVDADDEYRSAAAFVGKIAMVLFIGTTFEQVQPLMHQFVNSYCHSNHPGVRRWVATTWINYGDAFVQVGRVEDARVCYQQVVDEHRSTKDVSLRNSVELASASLRTLP
jgi:tetratricopeptide (TPR) repeat protein